MWVSVEDRLPKKTGRDYLCYGGPKVLKGATRILYFIGGISMRFETSFPPTHWQPLPEPPESK